MALVRGLPDRGRRSPARRRCRCRWTPTPGTTSTRCWPRSPTAPGWCWSAPPTTRPGRRSTRTSSTRFLDRVPADVLVVIDEAYLEFVTDPEAPDALATVPAPAQRGGAADLLQGLRAGRPAGRATPSRTSRSPQALRKTAVPFGVSDIAQQAAVASLDGVRRAAGARRRAGRRARRGSSPALREQGWAVPQTEANFVWLPLGEGHAGLRRGRGRGRAGRAAVRRRRRALHHRRDRGQRPAASTWRAGSGRRRTLTRARPVVRRRTARVTSHSQPYGVPEIDKVTYDADSGRMPSLVPADPASERALRASPLVPTLSFAALGSQRWWRSARSVWRSTVGRRGPRVPRHSVRPPA